MYLGGTVHLLILNHFFVRFDIPLDAELGKNKFGLPFAYIPTQIITDEMCLDSLTIRPRWTAAGVSEEGIQVIWHTNCLIVKSFSSVNSVLRFSIVRV